MLRTLVLGAVMALLACGGRADASIQITDLFNTGVDAGGAALAGGVADPHYTMVEQPGTSYTAVTIASPPGVWVANNAGSRWIGPNSDSQGRAEEGVYAYETTFTLPSFADLSSVVISGLWATDNQGLDIVINGVSTGQMTGTTDFNTLTSFSITDNFVHGTNTIRFRLENLPATPNPTGLRVDQIQGSFSAVPEPATVAMWSLFGLAGVAFGVRRRLRRA